MIRSHTDKWIGVATSSAFQIWRFFCEVCCCMCLEYSCDCIHKSSVLWISRSKIYDHSIIQSQIQKKFLANGVCHNIYFWWTGPPAICGDHAHVRSIEFVHTLVVAHIYQSVQRTAYNLVHARRMKLSCQCTDTCHACYLRI